jgi:hypothetical protein
MQSQYQENEAEDAWAQIAPMLDGAIGSLGASDRNAVVLRFLEGRELKDVGQAIGASEEAAKKRVHRALEKLRKFFTKRGVILSGSVLASAIAANSATAAPAGLAASITAVGALKAATAGASTMALFEGTLKALAWAKLKLAAGIGAVVVLAAGTAVVAVALVAEASHTPNKAPTLNPNSPFVRYLANPPWIKMMQVARVSPVFTGNPGYLNTNPPPAPRWNHVTNTFGIQPSGAYYALSNSTPGVRVVSGVDDQIHWSAFAMLKRLVVTPLASADYSAVPNVEQALARMEEVRHLGLPGLRPGTFAMHEDGTFTATTMENELLEGKILKVSNDRPLELSYQLSPKLVSRDTGMAIFPAFVESTESKVTITYQYASATAPLPASYGYSQELRASRQGRLIPNQDGSEMLATNYILSAEYGLDESISNGYSPEMLLPDVAQFRRQVYTVSNGVHYIDGVARPPPGVQIGGQGTVTNRAGK